MPMGRILPYVRIGIFTMVGVVISLAIGIAFLACVEMHKESEENKLIRRMRKYQEKVISIGLKGNKENADTCKECLKKRECVEYTKNSYMKQKSPLWLEENIC